jgi:hypothetical protein
MNAPLISRDIRLCAHKVGRWITRESRAITDRTPRSLSGALTGSTLDKNSGQLELTGWRWTGKEVVIPYSSGIRTPALSSTHSQPTNMALRKSQADVHSVFGIRTVGSESAVLPACRSKGSGDY